MWRLSGVVPDLPSGVRWAGRCAGPSIRLLYHGASGGSLNLGHLVVIAHCPRRGLLGHSDLRSRI